MILRSLDGKFFELDDSLLAGKEVEAKDIPNLPASLPPPDGADVEGHDCYHWYNWHNHHWHNCHQVAE